MKAGKPLEGRSSEASAGASMVNFHSLRRKRKVLAVASAHHAVAASITVSIVANANSEGKAMKQDSLFDAAPAQPHSETSVAAAEAIEPVAATMRRMVLNWLRSRGDDGGTDEEGIAATGMSPSTYRPRRVELVSSGLVCDSARTRKTVAGRKAVVWIAWEYEPANELRW